MNDLAARSYAVPSPCNLPKSEIESLAEAVAEAYEYQPGESLLPVVRSMGGDIQISDLSESSSGSIIMGPKGFSITLPLHTGPLRDRFTVAHELGHWFLHYLGADASERGSEMMASRYGSGRIETEANWFAAAFLMPKNQFRSEWLKFAGEVSKVAETFGVSEAAASVRAQALGLS